MRLLRILSLDNLLALLQIMIYASVDRVIQQHIYAMNVLLMRNALYLDLSVLIKSVKNQMGLHVVLLINA
jgi:hypothetical protein